MKIPQEIKKKAETIIAEFNESTFDNSDDFGYMARYKGNFLYLDRKEGDLISEIARLKYTGDFTDWEFAIYKYSTSRYDPDEWFFPGIDNVDGTILGALKAAQQSY